MSQPEINLDAEKDEMIEFVESNFDPKILQIINQTNYLGLDAPRFEVKISTEGTTNAKFKRNPPGN